MAEQTGKYRIVTCLFILIILIIIFIPFESLAAEEEGQQDIVVFSIGQQNYSIGEKVAKTDVAPYIKDGRTMVPAAFLAEALGAEEIQWISSERKVVIKKGDRQVSVMIGSKDLYVDHDRITMDVSAEISNVGNGGGRTMLPIAFAARAFEIAYEWDKTTRSVHILKYNKIFSRPGVFGPGADNLTIRGNATVKSDQVTLQNLKIMGNLIVDKEVGTGTVYLKNITVLGDTLVRGGGKNSIHIIGGSYQTIIVQGTGDGMLRVVARDTEGLEVVIAEGMSGEGVILEGNFRNVQIEGNHVSIQTQGDTFINNFNIPSGIVGSVISLGNGTTVGNMVIESQTSVSGNGTIQTIVGEEAVIRPAAAPMPSGSSSGDSSSPTQVTFADIDQKNAGQVIDISGLISDLKRSNGQLASDRAYSVTVSSNVDGALFGPANINFASGRPAAAINIQLSTAGLHTLTLQTGSAQDTATVQVLPGAAAKLQLAGSETMEAGETSSFTVEAQDLYGNPVVLSGGITDIITVTDHKGTLTPAAVSIPTNASGAGFTLRCTQAGIYTLTAASNGLASSVHEITVVPAEASEVIIESDDTESLIAGELLDFHASAYDIYGNVITFDAEDFTWTGANDGAFSEQTTGNYTVSAEYNGVQSAAETVAVIAGQVDSVSLAGLPSRWEAGQTIDLLDPASGCSIELLDRYGNTVADGEYPITIRSNREELPLFGQGPVQFTNGQSGPPGPGGNTVTIPIRLTASGTHIITVQVYEKQTSVTVQADPGTASQFAFTEDDFSSIAGESKTIHLEVRDEFGNRTGNHSGLTDVVSASGGTVSPNSISFASGESQKSLEFTSSVSGSYQITAAYDPMTPAYFNITVNPAAPAALTVGAVVLQEAGESFNLALSSLMDSLGNVLLNGTYHLQIESDREGSVLDDYVIFTAGSRTQPIRLNQLGEHLLSFRINDILVADDVAAEIMKYDVTGVDIDQASPLTIKMEETAQLSATIAPANATYPQIIWSSSDPDIATVGANGIVTGVNKGNAVITATSADSGISDSIAVVVDYPDISGMGTPEKPFIIYNFAGLEKIGTGKYVAYKTTLGPVYYQLGADIDASPTGGPAYDSGKGWKPIDTLRMRFDGKGYKISNLTINRPTEDEIGLFGLVETSRISNLALENADITGKNYVGGIAGRLKYADMTSNSVKGSVAGVRYVGGLAGSAYGPFGSGYKYISECYTEGVVSASEFYAGGLLGIMSEIMDVQNSYSQAAVSAYYGDAGGLIGYVSRYGKVTNCYASGQVSATWAHASDIGGLIGALSTDNTKITNSYYDKETTGRSDTGKGIPRTTSQMKAGTNSSAMEGEAMYTNWDSELYPFHRPQVWEYGTDLEYPVLKDTP